jgi:hypothetical protein
LRGITSATHRFSSALPLLLSSILLGSSSLSLGSWRVEIHGVLRTLSNGFFLVNRHVVCHFHQDQKFLFLILLPHYDNPSAGCGSCIELPLSRLMTCSNGTSRFEVWLLRRGWRLHPVSIRSSFAVCLTDWDPAVWYLD